MREIHGAPVPADRGGHEPARDRELDPVPRAASAGAGAEDWGAIRAVLKRTSKDWGALRARAEKAERERGEAAAKATKWKREATRLRDAFPCDGRCEPGECVCPTEDYDPRTISDLRAELERLTRERDAAHDTREDARQVAQRAEDEVERLRAELERVKGERDEAVKDYGQAEVVVRQYIAALDDALVPLKEATRFLAGAERIALLAADRDRLRAALEEAHSLIDRAIMGDIDPSDPDNPLLCAAQVISASLAPAAGEEGEEKSIPVDVDILGGRVEAIAPAPADDFERGSWRMLRLLCRPGVVTTLCLAGGREIRICVQPRAGGTAVLPPPPSAQPGEEREDS